MPALIAIADTEQFLRTYAVQSSRGSKSITYHAFPDCGEASRQSFFGAVRAGKEQRAPAGTDDWPGRPRSVPLRVYVPHVQESGVAGSRNLRSSLPSCTIQCGTNFFFGFHQLSQWHLKCRTRFQTVEVLEDCQDNLFVLSISTLGHVRLHHCPKCIVAAVV